MLGWPQGVSSGSGCQMEHGQPGSRRTAGEPQTNRRLPRADWTRKQPHPSSPLLPSELQLRALALLGGFRAVDPLKVKTGPVVHWHPEESADPGYSPPRPVTPIASAAGSAASFLPTMPYSGAGQDSCPLHKSETWARTRHVEETVCFHHAAFFKK